ncbi:MAG: hypothetical protein ACM3US_09935 [Sphingomonadaceae bacterium]
MSRQHREAAMMAVLAEATRQDTLHGAEEGIFRQHPRAGLAIAERIAEDLEKAATIPATESSNG